MITLLLAKGAEEADIKSFLRRKYRYSRRVPCSRQGLASYAKMVVESSKTILDNEGNTNPANDDIVVVFDDVPTTTQAAPYVEVAIALGLEVVVDKIDAKTLGWDRFQELFKIKENHERV